MHRARSSFSAIQEPAQELCTKLCESFLFWCVCVVTTLVEPILCANHRPGPIHHAQIAMIVLNTVFFFVQLVGFGKLSTEDNDETVETYIAKFFRTKDGKKKSYVQKYMEWCNNKIQTYLMCSSADGISTDIFQGFLFLAKNGEYILDFFCLLCGWIFIWTRPGLAALRCYRVFRLLWYCKIEVVEKDSLAIAKFLFGDVGVTIVKLTLLVMHFAVNSLMQLGQEMFFLTKKTRGGLILMGVIFYAAFVLGAALWIDFGNPASYCYDMGSCIFTLFRLTVFDGNGLDFAFSLAEEHKFLFFLTIVYCCATAFGVLNGLTGVFGSIFNYASEEAFNGNSESTQSSTSSIKNDNLNDDADDGDMEACTPEIPQPSSPRGGRPGLPQGQSMRSVCSIDEEHTSHNHHNTNGGHAHTIDMFTSRSTSRSKEVVNLTIKNNMVLKQNSVKLKDVEKDIARMQDTIDELTLEVEHLTKTITELLVSRVHVDSLGSQVDQGNHSANPTPNHNDNQHSHDQGAVVHADNVSITLSQSNQSENKQNDSDSDAGNFADAQEHFGVANTVDHINESNTQNENETI